VQTKLFIDGQFVDALAGGTIPVYNPYTGEVICDIAEARAEDVDRAVEAALRAQPMWRAMDATERGNLLLRLADAIDAHGEELVQLEAQDTGHPVRDARKLDVPRTSRCFRYFGGMADKFEGFVPPVYPGFLNYVQREPIGVVGQIVPWNFPLMFTSWKMAPALAAGNCIVIKPSELTPLTSLRIAELMRDVGFPDGVVNMVPGYGHTAGARIAAHPRYRQGGVHRLHGDWPADCRGLDRQPQEGAARTGRQRPQHRVRRCQCAGRDRRLGLRHFPQSGAGLHRRLAPHPAQVDRRRVSRWLQQARQVHPAGRSSRSRNRDGTADLEAAPGACAALLAGGRRAGR
jgi:hypothetical protein